MDAPKSIKIETVLSQVSRPTLKRFTVHTDFMSETFRVFFKSFLDNIKVPIELHLPLESTLLKDFLHQLVSKSIFLKIYQIYKECDYLDNFEVAEVLEILKKYDKCTHIKVTNERFDPYSYTSGKAKIDSLLIENSEFLILGETLICGKGMHLAEKAIERNKKIYCVLPDYFSYGFVGSEFLITSNSAHLLHINSF